MNSEMGIQEVDESLKFSLMTTIAKEALQFDMDINMSGCSLIWTSTCQAWQWGRDNDSAGVMKWFCENPGERKRGDLVSPYPTPKVLGLRFQRV